MNKGGFCMKDSLQDFCDTSCVCSHSEIVVQVNPIVLVVLVIPVPGGNDVTRALQAVLPNDFPIF